MAHPPFKEPLLTSPPPLQAFLVHGDLHLAVADVKVEDPPMRLRVQLNGLPVGSRRVYSVYTTCPQRSDLEYVVPLMLAQPADNVSCAAALLPLLGQPAFRQRALDPLIARIEKS